MFLLWHPSLTAINLSYTFPILETSATALCGTTGIDTSRSSPRYPTTHWAYTCDSAESSIPLVRYQSKLKTVPPALLTQHKFGRATSHGLPHLPDLFTSCRGIRAREDGHPHCRWSCAQAVQSPVEPPSHERQKVAKPTQPTHWRVVSDEWLIVGFFHHCWCDKLLIVDGLVDHCNIWIWLNLSAVFFFIVMSSTLCSEDSSYLAVLLCPEVKLTARISLRISGMLWCQQT